MKSLLWICHKTNYEMNDDVNKAQVIKITNALHLTGEHKNRNSIGLSDDKIR